MAPEAASMPWLCEYMRLRSWGLTPPVSPLECMASRPSLAEFFGPRTASGYTFFDHDSTKYAAYVKELYIRVLQQPWPISGVVPFHFACGLLAEANGQEVNWAEFSFKQIHPYQSDSRVPRVLPQFADLVEPLEDLEPTIPRADMKVRPHTLTLSLEFCSISWSHSRIWFVNVGPFVTNDHMPLHVCMVLFTLNY